MSRQKQTVYDWNFTFGKRMRRWRGMLPLIKQTEDVDYA
jgi:hypothetical protein